MGVLVVFTVVVQRWFGLSTTSGSQVTLAAIASKWEQWQTIVLWSTRLLLIFLLVAGAGRNMNSSPRCLSCQSSSRFPISAPYQCAIDG
ncbi:hypothetical protein BDP55DRAFT_22299 [Colletotrichum godetiae]|uniref:Uncharacterized protein n=1 Tax=Colletotrichum godetiae TaxID=1209918 RepID=A0AAJ0B115_9PEZI|nr:uncharacterized protein BDP55DRAFT_22299 [Colletotrichum godetiae]KAK1701488.1 hypothetical protein BDP55DRAFT_22299 [Colletotrichum godetiae]